MMKKPTDTISTTTQRQYILGKQGLWPGRRWRGQVGVAQAIPAVEAVQVDPVSVIATSHDLVLWGRVDDYQPAYLNNLMYTERKFFDYGGCLMIYPMSELPYWRVVMARQKSRKRWADFIEANPALLAAVRQELRDRGPLRSRDIKGKAVEHYRSSKDTGVALYCLWITGELMTHNRRGRERIYDFMENIAPADLQWTAPEAEAIQFFVRKEISQWGLVSERDIRRILKGAYDRPIDAQEAKTTLAEMVAGGQLGEVRLENDNNPRYFLAEDAPLLHTLADGQCPTIWQPLETTTSQEVTFLSPLEYVSARGRAKKLFNFDYIWEIYKPAIKRKYGPYTMPILYGNQLVARLDTRLDRPHQRLVMNGFWLEAGFIPDEAFALALAKGLLNFVTFLEAKQVDIAALQPELVRVQVGEYLRSSGFDV